MLHDCDTLDQYLTTYGPILGQQTQRSLAPLHVPDRDPLLEPTLLRKPFPAQSHCITALAKQLARDDAAILVAEMGTGKTLMAMAATHAHAAGKPYRALVFGPPQLVKKWGREILETIPGATVRTIRSYLDLVGIDPSQPPDGPTWYVVSETMAKMGAEWKPVFKLWQPRRRLRKELRAKLKLVPQCPSCGRQLLDKQGVPLSVEKLTKRRHFCTGGDDEPGCGSPLWSYTGNADRWAPAKYIKDHLPGYFDYLILDEVHEENSPSSARATAMGQLTAACRKVIALTGTLTAGYAWHLRTLLFRLAPRSIVQEGFTWNGVTSWNEVYGRMEYRVVTTDYSESADDNKRSKGSSTRTEPSVRPGIMPTLFGRHLLDKCVFLSLDEVADNLPPLEEALIPVGMDAEQRGAYVKLETKLRETMQEMLRRNDRRLLGAMLHALMAYPDHPFDWDAVGFWDDRVAPDGISQQRTFVPVAYPENLDFETVRPKEQKLVEVVRAEVKQGRQCWVFVEMTGKRDVAAILGGMFENEGLRVRVLRSDTVTTAKREDWIAEHAPNVDVVISHPRLVRTGLDLFCKQGRHNFSTLIFYETGYDLFTLRQAARRSWRIGQHLLCKVVYLFYSSTMQDRAMTLMGRKMTASAAIEGKFSSEGLAAMAGDDANMELALARSLVNQLDDVGADRAWEKVASEKVGNAAVLREAPAAVEVDEPEEVELPAPLAAPLAPSRSMTVTQLSFFGLDY